MDKSNVPFAIQYTPQLAELILKLNISLAITTYQAGKVVFISPVPEGDRLLVLPRSFEKPMGMVVEDDKMALATKDEVIVFKNSKELATHYPNKPHTYDNLWVPRATYHTGRVDLHDLSFGEKGIYAINTSFSCICTVNDEYSFTPVWKPLFIDALVSEDRCHLNGLVMKGGQPKYVTALGTSNHLQGWRDNITSGGVLIDVVTNEIILEGLAMPHSPLMYNDELYLLLSASGEFVKVDIASKKYEVLKKFDGFCRGLTIYKDHAFIAFSKLRKNSSTFAKLPFSDKANFAGIKIIHLPTAALVGEIIYQNSVDEIYEVEVLLGMLRPNILNTINDIHKMTLSIPNATFWANPQSLENSK